MNELELILKYPLIHCSVHDKIKHYKGRIMCGNLDVNLHLTEEIISHGNSVFKLETKFGEEFDSIIDNIIATSVTEFLDKIVIVLRRQFENRSQDLTHVYRRILREYSELTEFHLSIKKCHISSDLSEIVITTTDEGNRQHLLKISVDFNDVKCIFNLKELNLPEKVTKDFPAKFHDLSEIYTKFVAAVESLQLFFDVVDDLDRNSCVLDPEKPTKRDCYRQIWLDQNLSVAVFIDPLNVRARPELKFLGPEHILVEYQNKLQEKLDEWDEDGCFSEELLKLLELENFPVRPHQDSVLLMDTGECSICFSLRLNDKLPEVICENKSCSKYYHIECLYEWLISFNPKRVFNKLEGQCLNCEKRIACPIPERKLS